MYEIIETKHNQKVTIITWNLTTAATVRVIKDNGEGHQVGFALLPNRGLWSFQVEKQPESNDWKGW